ncbi:MAG: hypothetical protein N5P05_004451 (plasmid) [Chroococcopsis gigantea SAG 12.99]|nr:hypothetical protein [Chlorogloea purpurea SAG 13.99]MDV3002796.1 hypothetical protein [Chroococcopsis gigantea SAG 12.99]
MSQFHIPAFLTADALTEGDLVKYCTGEIWLIITEPLYTTKGIEFEVLPIEDTETETQSVCVEPRRLFEILGYRSQAGSVMVTPGQTQQNTLNELKNHPYGAL